MRYEYRILQKVKNQLAELNKLGSEGWKIITVDANEIYLIREKREV